jgi:hypothetical protein
MSLPLCFNSFCRTVGESDGRVHFLEYSIMTGMGISVYYRGYIDEGRRTDKLESLRVDFLAILHPSFVTQPSYDEDVGRTSWRVCKNC